MTFALDKLLNNGNNGTYEAAVKDYKNLKSVFFFFFLQI